MQEFSIRVDGVGKRYSIKTSEDRVASLPEMLGRMALNPLSGGRSSTNRSGCNDFWALQDVSFEVRPGEVIGVIGGNGAGKSTLLKILSRITEPTVGEIELRGRVGSLLEVGTGFHPELSGRENIYLNGAMLGMRRQEIQQRFDEIVAFAEIDRFLDTPVKRYSSGMYTRLAFAVAAHLQPDILLVDEVLAVGDAAFQRKCLGRMGDLASEGRTIFFVSHNMRAVNRLCSRAVWLDHGRLVEDGPTSQVLGRYLTDEASEDGCRTWPEGFANPGVNDLGIYGLQLTNEDEVVTSNLDAGRAFTVQIDYRVHQPLPPCRVGFVLSTSDGIPVFEAYDTDNALAPEARQPGPMTSRCLIPGNLLSPGRYILSINAGIPGQRNLAYLEGALAFNVEDFTANGALMRSETRGIIRPRLDWSQNGEIGAAQRV